MTYESLEPGTYILFTEVDWAEEHFAQEYQITAYCE